MANPIIHDLKGKRVLVTGAAGLIGRPLIKLLIDEGADVHGVDIQYYSNVSYRPRKGNEPTESYSKLDLNDQHQASMCIESQNLDYVFHLAGAKGGAGIGRSHGVDFLTANVRCTMNLIEALVKTDFKGRLLFTSSVGAYSGDMEVFTEDRAMEGEPHPSDFYGGSAKRFGELLCRAAHEQGGLDYVVVRPTATFGPYDRFDPKTSMVIPALIARLEAGENPLVLTGNPDTRRDFLYSDDAAMGMLLAMKQGRTSSIYNLGTGGALKVRDIAEYLCHIYDRKLEVAFSIDSSPSIRCMDMTKSQRELGFKPEFSPQGLETTVQWYKENKGAEKWSPFNDERL